MGSSKVIFLLLLLSSQGGVRPGARQRQFNSVVHVQAWTTSGERIEKVWVVLTPVSGGSQDYKGSGTSVDLTVPTDEYILRVDAPGFEGRRQILRVYQPEVLRTVALPVARIEATPPYSSMSGRVTNYDSDLKNIRVRLVSLYGNELRESAVSGDGTFAFPVDEGAQLLLTVADTDRGLVLLDSRPLRIAIGSKESVVIDLKGKLGQLVK